ncbi:MAG: hypothetical protein WA792_15040 [Pseudolabrys sp.]
MRVLLAIGLLVSGALIATPAEAGHRHYDYQSSIGRRALPIVVYDYEPGVVVRAYWSAPWRNRHYFPTRRKVDITARDEDVSTGSAEPIKPAESFHREWSTSSSFAPEGAQAGMPAIDDMPPPQPRGGITQQNPNAPKFRP